MTGLDDTLEPRLARLEAQHRRRSLRTFASGSAPRLAIGGREVLQFCSNDYLGLAADPRLERATVEAASRFGCGGGSSRLVAGTTELHSRLEQELADLKGTQAALLFTSGYHANLGVLAALVGHEDMVFSDANNHASLIDGCRLSRAAVKVYRHVDVSHLEELLAAAPPKGRRLIVTETVFSMDGDVAPLREIVAAARRFGAWVLVDEAHATGVFGPRGGGLVEEQALARDVDVQIGTLGKALGSLGAFAAGSRTLVEWLVNTARTFIYTTALAPPAVGAALAGVEIARGEPARRQRLWDHASTMRSGLGQLGYTLGPGGSPILPVLVGDDERALRLSAALLEHGVLVPAIRPPTVPSGTARLRVTPMATHSDDEIRTALNAFATAGRESGVLS